MITHSDYLKLIQKLKTSLPKNEELMGGHYLFFEFDSSDFEVQYATIQTHLGKRTSYYEKSFETEWKFKTEKIASGSLKLHFDHIEIFIEIPSSPEDILNDITVLHKPEEMEYLFRHSEYEKERIKKLSVDSNLFQMYKAKLEAIRSKRAEIESRISTDIEAHLEIEIKKLENETETELKKIKQLEEFNERKKALEKRKIELQSRSQNLLKKSSQGPTSLPVGYDYNLRFYKNQLGVMRMKYGADSEIDQAMGKIEIFGNKRELPHRFAKRYVDLYKVKYEGVSTWTSFDNPVHVNVGFNSYIQNLLQKQKDDAVGLWLFGFGLILFFLILGLIMSP